MQKLDLTTLPKKIKPAPIFKGLKKSLKDPACFEEIEKKLIDIIRINHTHKTASSYAKCEECNKKREERKKVMKDIGFKSIQQYLQWKKIHTIIRDKKNFQVK